MGDQDQGQGRSGLKEQNKSLSLSTKRVEKFVFNDKRVRENRKLQNSAASKPLPRPNLLRALQMFH